jgi:hypothetical protein
MSFLSPTKVVSSGGLLRRVESEKESLLGSYEDRASTTSSTQPFGPSPVKKKAKSEDPEYGGSYSLQPRVKEPFVETEVQKGESLASIALKYNVSAAELKRLNNIIGESEFFALKRIKIPVKPLSALAEQYQQQRKSDYAAQLEKDGQGTDGWLVEHFSTPPGVPGSSEISSPAALSDAGSEDLHLAMIDASATKNHNQNSRQVKRTQKLLKNVDKDLAVIKQRNEALVSTVISPANLEKLEENSWDDGEEDVFLGQEDESKVRLLPSAHSVQVSRVSSLSKVACLVCLALIVIAVFVILWFADYEFEAIEKETLAEAEKHAKGHATQ